MSIGYLRAAGLLRRAFSRYPFRHKLHIAIRFLTCPFVRTLDVIPPGSRMMDIGAGHGSYAHLALDAGAREVVCVEPDLRKAFLPISDPRIRWVAGFDDCIRGTFDVISIYDATYRMTLEVRTAIFRRAFDRLKPGGTFILKDLDPGHPFKARWARFQEWLSDTFLHISLGSGFIYQSRADVQRTLELIGFRDLTAKAIDRGYPHAHIIYTAKKP
jgi:SAM-dependent methyltransferase